MCMLNSKLGCSCLALTEAQYRKGGLSFRATLCVGRSAVHWWVAQDTSACPGAQDAQFQHFPVTSATSCTTPALLAPFLSKISLGKCLFRVVSLLFSLCFVLILMYIYLDEVWWLPRCWPLMFFVLVVDPEEFPRVTSVQLMLRRWKNTLYMSTWKNTRMPSWARTPPTLAYFKHKFRASETRRPRFFL